MTLALGWVPLHLYSFTAVQHTCMLLLSYDTRPCWGDIYCLQHSCIIYCFTAGMHIIYLGFAWSPVTALRSRTCYILGVLEAQLLRYRSRTYYILGFAWKSIPALKHACR